MMLINPGSHIGESDGSWTNTIEEAEKIAREWLSSMHDEGLRDVELVAMNRRCVEGRWPFRFRHSVTGVVVTLETHGISDIEAYKKDHVFRPRVYWDGSSCGEPCLDDFAADGFRKVKTWEVLEESDE